MAFRRAEQEEEDVLAAHDEPLVARDGAGPLVQRGAPVPQEADLSRPQDAGYRDENDEGVERMRKHPLFGMF